MKYLLALAMVLNLAACSKDSGKSGGLTSQPQPVSPDTGTSVVTVPNDPDNDQVQDDKSEVKKPFAGMNVKIDYAKSAGEIEIKKEDARRLFNRLAIASEMKISGDKKSETKIRYAKHITCTEDSCSLKLDLKEAEVIANENMGARISKLFPSLLNYKGENLSISGFSKVGTITVKGTEAEKLYDAIELKEALGVAKDKDIREKKGTGDAGFACSKTLNEKAENEFKCSVKFSVVNGAVISSK